MPFGDDLFAGINSEAGEELFTTILERPGLKIERIVSTGQSSPPEFWYDQPWAEWVLVIHGEAVLAIEGERDPRSMKPGHSLFLPARCRHRVEATSPNEPTVWLAIHWDEDRDFVDRNA